MSLISFCSMYLGSLLWIYDRPIGETILNRGSGKSSFRNGSQQGSWANNLIAGFYQLHWDLLGGSLIVAVLDFLNSGVLPDDVNRTTIAIILKTSNPQEMKVVRLISPCNVLYKICSKVLVLRLRVFLDEIIAEKDKSHLFLAD